MRLRKIASQAILSFVWISSFPPNKCLEVGFILHHCQLINYYHLAIRR